MSSLTEIENGDRRTPVSGVDGESRPGSQALSETERYGTPVIKVIEGNAQDDDSDSGWDTDLEIEGGCVCVVPFLEVSKFSKLT